MTLYPDMIINWSYSITIFFVDAESFSKNLRIYKPFSK